MPIRAKIYSVNDINLHVAEAGNTENKIIIFLHGFPECWYAWHKQLPYFAEKGFWVIAPDQRGYNLSSKPAGVKSYSLANLTRDIAALIRQLTSNKVILVGHDWGGGVAWAMATYYPELLEKLIILNMPHPDILRQNLWHNPKQTLKSWYAGFFQLPYLPEIACQAFNYQLLARSLTKTTHRNTFTAEDLKKYKQAWRQPGALKAMINWYRAFNYNQELSAELLTTPTLLIWGKKDTFLSSEMAPTSIAKCREGQLVFLPEATHWLHHEKAEEVNKLIYDFVK